MLRLLTVVVFLGFGALHAFTQQMPDRQSLALAVKTLSERTTVPLRLPTFTPPATYLNAKERKMPLKAVVTEASTDSFSLEYCFSGTCHGAYYYGVISGEKITSETQRPSGKTVNLAKGITGYFEEGSCGASCGHGMIIWDQDGYRYTAGLNVEDDLKTLTKFANSAIDSGLVPQSRLEISSLKNPNVVEGCSCGFRTAAEAKKPDSQKWLFLSELGSNQGWMNINGKDTQLKLLKSTENNDRQVKVGDRYYEEYSVSGTTVRIDYVTKWVCPPRDEACETTEYDVKITVTNGGSSQIVTGTGSCGC